MWNVRRGALLNEGRCRPEECDVERRLAAAILRVDGGAVAEEEVGDEPAMACTVRDTAVVDQF